MREIPEGILERIKVKNPSKHEINDQMGKHVNQNLNLIFSPLKETRAFSLAISSAGQKTWQSRCCGHRVAEHLSLQRGVRERCMC